MEKLIEICHEITKRIEEFDYNISYTDKIWKILFPLTEPNKWHRMTIIKYPEKFYFHDMIGYSLKSIEFDGKNINRLEGLGEATYLYKEEIVNWSNLLNSLLKWLNTVGKDWIKANKKVCEEYPIDYRYGVVPASIVKSSRPDYFFDLSRKLGKKESDYFITLVDSSYFSSRTNKLKEDISANDFFEYCKLAYIASERDEENIDKNLTGKEMYLKYADGRCNGLTEIDSNSVQEFREWMDGKHPKFDYGGHPWEIKRGGNSTHIDLNVIRDKYDKNKMYLEVSAGAINRLKEAVQIANTLHMHNVPINIRNADSIRQRILGQDNFGIIPKYQFHSYAERNFNSDQKVFDTIHYKDLGRYKRRIKPFISWDVLPILKPKN